MGVYLVDLLQWLSGKRVRRVLCQVKTLEKRVRVEDNASVLLECTDGTMGSFDVSWTTRPYEVATHFFGDRGQVETSLSAGRQVTVRLAQRRGDPNYPLGAPRHPLLPRARRGGGGAYPGFVRAIVRGHSPPVSGEEGRDALEVVLGAYESARLSKWVELNSSRPRRQGRPA